MGMKLKNLHRKKYCYEFYRLADSEGKTYVEGILEQNAEEDIWTYKT
jgi:hypothetical protein